MKVTAKVASQSDRMVYISDFTPPRAVDPAYVMPARQLEVDYICVAYSPGRRVRVDPAMFAAALKQQTGRDVMFNLAPRDMNKLALQSHLLGAQMLGLENVVVIGGDVFSDKDLTQVTRVRDYKPTELIRAIKAMNQGLDYKDSQLKAATDFCVGASIDFGRGLEAEAALTYRKVVAGADFFISQPVFDVDEISAFREAYEAVAGAALNQPVFYGLQILQKDGIIFSSVPERIRQDLDQGRAGTDIALEQWQELVAAGVRTIYLIPPILRGGARDYAAAQQVIERADSG
jgi:5,10-methylenetetrahydrofolate reductase